MADDTAKIEEKIIKRMAPNLTDLGNAMRLVKRHGSNIRYCHIWGKWLTWDDKRWAIDENGSIMRFAKDTVRSIYLEASEIPGDKERKATAEHAIKSENGSRLREMISLAESEPGIPIQPEEFDTDKYLLNIKNGTLNLQTGTLIEHQREHKITKLAPVNYNLKAKCPTWLNFLERIFAGNKSLIRYTQKALGYSLTGDTKEQIIFILHGTGANGKSTLLEAIAAVLGDDYAQQTPTSTLMIRKNESIPNDVARLRGARFVSAVEAEEGQRLAESLVKQMTGGDRITARFMRSEFFEFKPEFKLFLGTNHKPRIRGTDHAIWRRIRLIPFLVTIPDEEQDKNLPDKLRAEKSGILNWLLDGCSTWQKEGLETPEEVKTATEGYRAEMDAIANFIDESCITEKYAKAPAADLYKKYQEWTEVNGEKALNQRAFGMRLTERGFTRVRGTAGRHLWEGIGLVNE